MKDNIIDKVALICIVDKKVLTALSHSKSKLYLPGGKREIGETDLECLKREIYEELNVQIKEDSVQYFETFEAPADGKTDGISVRMTCYFADYSGNPEPSNEIVSLEWITYQDRDRTSAVVKIILDKLKALKLIH